MERQYKKRFSIGVLGVLALSLASCGGSSESTSESTVEDTAVVESTVAASTLSGKLTWWSDWTIEQTEAFIKVFNLKHPGIKVEYTRSDDGEMFDKFGTESKAGTLDADIVIIGWDGFSRMWDADGLLLKHPSVEEAAFPVELYGVGGAWHTYGSLLEGICYNKDVLEEKGLEVPTAWEDLADPQYKDQIVMQDPLKVGSGAHDLMIETRVYWDDDVRWEKFWAGYGANKVVIQPSYTEAQQQVVQGNFGILGLCYLDYIQAAVAEGAPIVFVAADPVITVPFTVNIPISAPNPENAKAFVDFILSAEGQAEVANLVGQVPGRPGAPFPEPAKIAEGVPQQPALGTPRAAAEYKDNAQYYVDKAKVWFNLR